MAITHRYLDHLEELIRTNSAPQIDAFFKEHKKSKPPRALIARYTNLLRRMGATKYALTVLNPIVRNPLMKATVDETIEYASCLCRMDIIDEGIALLKSVNDQARPEVYLELAIAYMTKWQYQEAIPLLLTYLKFPRLSPYKICVAEINLAASYLYRDDKPSAEALLKKVLLKVRDGKFNLLWGNTLELLGELYLSQKKYDKATKCFLECSDKLQSSDPRYQVYLARWLSIIKIIKENGSEQSLTEWRQVRQKSAAINDWSSLRELELYKAVVTDDIESIKELYYGSHYPEYRKRILSVWGRPLELSDYYDRKIGPRKKGPTRVFDIETGKDLFSNHQLKRGKSLHRLIQALTSDSLTPFLTEKLFSLVFEGQYYNPVTSPPQVRQLVLRLNEWMERHQIPLKTIWTRSGYRLRASKPYIIRVPREKKEANNLVEFINLLLSHGLSEGFSIKKVIDQLGLSRRNAIRKLNEAIESGKITRQGRAKTTTYKII